MFLLSACGAAELTDAGVVGGVSFWNTLAPISIEGAAQATAEAASTVGGGAAALGANALSLGATALSDSIPQSSSYPRFAPQCVRRVPEPELITPYSDEIRKLREQVEASKSFKRPKVSR